MTLTLSTIVVDKNKAVSMLNFTFHNGTANGARLEFERKTLRDPTGREYEGTAEAFVVPAGGDAPETISFDLILQPGTSYTVQVIVVRVDHYVDAYQQVVSL